MTQEREAPVDGLVKRLRAATMRFDWADLPDDEPIPAVPLLREAAKALEALQAQLAEAVEALAPFASVFDQMSGNGKADEAQVWGYNDALLRYGDFRAARRVHDKHGSGR